MSNGNKTPKIRFPGFSDAWEQRKLSELTDYSNGTGHEEYVVAHGKYELITLKSINSEGELVSSEKYVDEKFETLKQGTLIMMLSEQAKGMLGMTTVIPCNDRYVLNQRVAALNLHDKIDASFLTKSINNKQAYFEQMGAGTKVQNISRGHVENCLIDIPCYEEQQRIGGYFNNLDNLITLHQHKCEAIKTVKKSMLGKMFPKNGERYPEIRFSEFSDAWEQRKLGELYEVNNERNKDLIGYDKTFSIATMTYKDEGNGAADSSLANYKVLRIGDIAFEGHTNMEFRYGRFVANDVGNGIMSPRFSTLRPINVMPVSFWKYYIHYEPIMRKILVCSTKAGTMMNELVASDFFAQDILVPSIEEQTKIGEYFQNLDNLIALHQRKCDELKKLKKYMLQNMFPRG